MSATGSELETHVGDPNCPRRDPGSDHKMPQLRSGSFRRKSTSIAQTCRCDEALIHTKAAFAGSLASSWCPRIPGAPAIDIRNRISRFS